MSKSTSYLPAGSQHVTPQLVVKDAHAYADALVALFDGKKLAEYPNPDGKGVMFAVVQIGQSKIFLSDTNPMSATTKANLMVYVPDVDATVKKIASHGGKVLAPPADMPWGDRWSLVEDPAGNRWQIAASIETLTPAEIEERLKSAAAAPPPAE
jgi:PhnB protein